MCVCNPVLYIPHLSMLVHFHIVPTLSLKLEHFLSTKHKKEKSNEQKFKSSNKLNYQVSKLQIMGEEFLGGVCGGNSWWNSSPNLFASSPCSMAINGVAGSFGWPNHDHLARSSDDSGHSGGSASDDSTTLQMMGICSLSSSTTSDVWNQDFIHDNGRSDENYSNMLQEVSGMNYQNCPPISKSFCDDFSINQGFPLDHQQPLNCITSNSTTDCVTTCQELSPGFPLNSATYSLLQTLFDTDSQTDQSLIDNQAMNYSINSNSYLPDFTKASTTTTMSKPSFAKQELASSMPNFTNTTPFWNATAAPPLSNVSTSFLPSTQSQFVPSSLNNKKPNLPSFNSKRRNQEVTKAKKDKNEPAFKHPRIETPSPLPTFKVRKEKLGDRITALQQLVSPFGKTDTASVLHEAIDYIKFLHDQVSVLTTPYLKNGSVPLQHQQVANKFKDQENQDLKSRGLCLVPISSTFPVASETTSDFWTPTFGGSFR